MAPTTMGQKPWSGDCWKARYEGASSVPKSGCHCSASRKPTDASLSCAREARKGSAVRQLE